MNRATTGLHSEVNEMGKVRVDPVPFEQVDSTAGSTSLSLDIVPLPAAVDGKSPGQLTRGRRPPWLRVAFSRFTQIPRA